MRSGWERGRAPAAARAGRPCPVPAERGAEGARGSVAGRSKPGPPPAPGAACEGRHCLAEPSQAFPRAEALPPPLLQGRAPPQRAVTARQLVHQSPTTRGRAARQLAAGPAPGMLSASVPSPYPPHLVVRKRRARHARADNNQVPHLQGQRWVQRVLGPTACLAAKQPLRTACKLCARPAPHVPHAGDPCPPTAGSPERSSWLGMGGKTMWSSWSGAGAAFAGVLRRALRVVTMGADPLPPVCYRQRLSVQRGCLEASHGRWAAAGCRTAAAGCRVIRAVKGPPSRHRQSGNRLSRQGSRWGINGRIVLRGPPLKMFPARRGGSGVGNAGWGGELQRLFEGPDRCSNSQAGALPRRRMAAACLAAACLLGVASAYKQQSSTAQGTANAGRSSKHGRPEPTSTASPLAGGL